jgi:biopolymer transport protein ExbD
MRFDLPAPRAGRAIGLTPLIDVVFILLLFFLLASHFHQWRALQLDTASAELDAERSAADEPPALLVRVHADGGVDINGEPLAPAQLPAALADWRDRRPELAVVVAAGADVRLQALVGVMDAVVAAGVATVRLQ